MPQKAKKPKVGQTVRWIGAGKIARLEGRHGKVCEGTVRRVYKSKIDQVTYVSVKTSFPNQLTDGCCIPVSALID